MPSFRVDDGQGNTLVLEGDSEPTEQELEDIFASQRQPQTSIGPTETSFESTGPADFQFEPADILGEQARQLPNLQATTRGGPQLQLPDANVAAQSAIGELGETAGEVLTHPSPIPTPFPEISKDENPFVAAGKEVVNLAIGVPQFFTTTPGIAAAGGATVAPGVVSGLFTADLLKTLGKQIKDTYSNWSNMTGAQKAIAVTDLIGTGAFAALTAKHAGKSAMDFAEQNIPRGTGISPEQPPLTPETYARQIVQPTEVPELEVRPQLGESPSLRPERPAPEPRPPADVGGDVVPIEEAPPQAPVSRNRIAVMDSDGTVFVSDKAETHAEFIDRLDPDGKKLIGAAGFVSPDGKFFQSSELFPQGEGPGMGELIDAYNSSSKKPTVYEPPAPEVAALNSLKTLQSKVDEILAAEATAQQFGMEFNGVQDYKFGPKTWGFTAGELSFNVPEGSTPAQIAEAYHARLKEWADKQGAAKPPVADYTGEPGEVAVTAEELKPATPPTAQTKISSIKQDDWELLAENLADQTDVFSTGGAARHGGQLAYDLRDAMQTFMDYARTKGDVSVWEAWKQFRDESDIPASQLKKLQAVLSDAGLKETKATPKPPGEVAVSAEELAQPLKQQSLVADLEFLNKQPNRPGRWVMSDESVKGAPDTTILEEWLTNTQDLQNPKTPTDAAIARINSAKLYAEARKRKLSFGGKPFESNPALEKYLKPPAEVAVTGEELVAKSAKESPEAQAIKAAKAEFERRNVPTEVKDIKVGDKLFTTEYGYITVEKVHPFDPKFPRSQIIETSRGRRDLDPTGGPIWVDRGTKITGEELQQPKAVETKAEAVAAQAVEQGVPPASVKQPEVISESSPPPEKIDSTAPFSPPTAETPPADVGPGMGAAKLEEVAVQGNPDIYGVAERVREERAKAGQVEPVEPGKGIAAKDSVERGRELLRSGTSAEQVLFNFEKTKQVSADDMAVVRAHGEDLAERARRIEEQHGTDSTEYKTARDFLTDWDKRSKAMQTEWHKIGQAQQGETDIDTGSFTGLARAYKDQTGKDFTPKQEKTAKDIAGKKKTADAEAETAKTTLFKQLAGDAEARAIAAAHKTVREAAVRMAGGVTKERVSSAARKQETAKVQSKAAQDALDAANKTVREAAARLGDAETKKRVAKSKLEKEAAEVDAKRAKKQLEIVQKRARTAAIKAARAETKLNVLRADKPAFVWSKAREYIEKGITNFDELRNKLATDLGMSVKEVTGALAATKRAKFLADEMWKKQQAARRIDQQAKQWLRDTTLPLYRRAIESVPKILFGLKVGFHGTVALGTHAPMVAFQPTFWKTYVNNFARMYRMVGSKAFYEMKVQDLLRDKNYITARRAGLVNDPFHFEDFNSPDIAKYMEKMTAMGNRGYAVLKMIRQDMFNQHWDNLPRSLKEPEMAKAIADGVNHATGVVKVSAPQGANIALFAPRLEMSRVAWLLVDPAIAMKTALEWKTASRAEKYFAIQQMKEKAWVAGTLYSILALNQGVLSATDSQQKVNGIPQALGGAGFDPMKGDFMKFKAAGMQLSYGNAMLTMARLPVRLYEIRTSDGGKLKNLVHPDENSYTVLGEYARSQLSPFASLVSTLWFKADWQNRPLPGSSRAVPKRLRAQGVQPYTWPEFWTEHVLPIPFEEAAREVWHSGLGMNDEQIKQMRKAMATIAIMGATGARLSDDWTVKQ